MSSDAFAPADIGSDDYIVAIFGAIALIVDSVIFAMFLRYRHCHPFSAKSTANTWVLAIVPNFMVFWLASDSMSLIPCGISQVVTFSSYCICAGTVIWQQVIRVWAKQGATIDRLSRVDVSSSAWLSGSRKWLLSDRNLRIGAVVSAIIPFTTFVTVVFILAGDAFSLLKINVEMTCTRDPGLGLFFVLIYAFLGLAVVISCLAFYLLIRKQSRLIRDGIGLRAELKAIGIIWAITVVCWLAGRQLFRQGTFFMNTSGIPAVGYWFTFLFTIGRGVRAARIDRGGLSDANATSAARLLDHFSDDTHATDEEDTMSGDNDAASVLFEGTLEKHRGDRYRRRRVTLLVDGSLLWNPLTVNSTRLQRVLYTMFLDSSGFANVYLSRIKRIDPLTFRIETMSGKAVQLRATDEDLANQWVSRLEKAGAKIAAPEADAEGGSARGGANETAWAADALDKARSDRRIAFETVFKSARGREKLRDFLAGEYAVENIDFLEAVEKFKGCSSPDAQVDMARHIFDTFMVEDSYSELNLDTFMIEEVSMGITDGGVPPDLFDDAVAAIKTLLIEDVFGRFLLQWKAKIMKRRGSSAAPSVRKGSSRGL